MDGSLSVCSGGSDAGSSYKATKRVRMAGTGLTVRSIVEELTVGRPGRAPTAERHRLGFGENCSGDRVQGGAGRVKKAAGVILGVRAAGIAARALRTRTAPAHDLKLVRVARSPRCACKEREGGL